MYAIDTMAMWADRDEFQAERAMFSLPAQYGYDTPDIFDDLDVSDLPTDADGYVI